MVFAHFVVDHYLYEAGLCAIGRSPQRQSRCLSHYKKKVKSLLFGVRLEDFQLQSHWGQQLHARAVLAFPLLKQRVRLEKKLSLPLLSSSKRLGRRW